MLTRSVECWWWRRLRTRTAWLSRNTRRVWAEVTSAVWADWTSIEPGPNWPSSWAPTSKRSSSSSSGETKATLFRSTPVTCSTTNSPRLSKTTSAKVSAKEDTSSCRKSPQALYSQLSMLLFSIYRTGSMAPKTGLIWQSFPMAPTMAFPKASALPCLYNANLTSLSKSSLISLYHKKPSYSFKTRSYSSSKIWTLFNPHDIFIYI